MTQVQLLASSTDVGGLVPQTNPPSTAVAGKLSTSGGENGPMATLSPAPEDLAALLIRMCQEPWPTTEEERQRYFRTLQLTDSAVPGNNPDEQDPDSQWRDFTTALTGPVDGSCITFQGQFLGLSLFAYHQLEPNAEPAREGYVAVRRSLSLALGDPIQEWGTADQPACQWRPGVLALDMYSFQRRDSGIMVGPSHSSRSAAHEAAAINRRRAPKT